MQMLFDFRRFMISLTCMLLFKQHKDYLSLHVQAVEETTSNHEHTSLKKITIMFSLDISSCHIAKKVERDKRIDQSPIIIQTFVFYYKDLQPIKQASRHY